MKQCISVEDCQILKLDQLNKERAPVSVYDTKLSEAAFSGPKISEKENFEDEKLFDGQNKRENGKNVDGLNGKQQNQVGTQVSSLGALKDHFNIEPNSCESSSWVIIDDDFIDD